MEPEAESDLGEWPGINATEEAADSEGIGGAPGDPPATLEDHKGLNACGVSGNV